MIAKDGTSQEELTDDALVVEIDDEIFGVLKRVADARGIAVGDLAGRLLNEAVAKNSAGRIGRTRP